jgi:hypothetical protein
LPVPSRLFAAVQKSALPLGIHLNFPLASEFSAGKDFPLASAANFLVGGSYENAVS